MFLSADLGRRAPHHATRNFVCTRLRQLLSWRRDLISTRSTFVRVMSFAFTAFTEERRYGATTLLVAFALALAINGPFPVSHLFPTRTSRPHRGLGYPAGVLLRWARTAHEARFPAVPRCDSTAGARDLTLAVVSIVYLPASPRADDIKKSSRTRDHPCVRVLGLISRSHRHQGRSSDGQPCLTAPFCPDCRHGYERATAPPSPPTAVSRLCRCSRCSS